MATNNTGDRSSQPEIGGLGGVLKKIGLSDSLGNTNVQGMAGKARDFARANPGKVLGGLSALIIGAGLLANRGRR